MMNKVRTILGGALVIIAAGYLATIVEEVKRRKEFEADVLEELS